ncbi:hypothetical protein HYPSUDRAFT_612351 [Hypholoma sublateritium FD-334 SS-4]|uniref:Uncharacterized protein n=1 Tax=Hypholoma sublateritium (strain FD-334 SS-4) TaxID=945553 RepID=A0A0D2L781_HYPSF|nr:hypothetical protein HYPSUDRAFT_612351 [Hypholoma sublateritium FD-334 SS-4]
MRREQKSQAATFYNELCKLRLRERDVSKQEPAYVVRCTLWKRMNLRQRSRASRSTEDVVGRKEGEYMTRLLRFRYEVAYEGNGARQRGHDHREHDRSRSSGFFSARRGMVGLVNELISVGYRGSARERVCVRHSRVCAPSCLPCLSPVRRAVLYVAYAARV